VDEKLEVVVIPVADADRAKEFYLGLGWRLDADRAAGDSFRIVQLTPPGSDCSIQFGTGLTSAPPGSARDLYLADAMRRASAAHGEHEKRIGAADANWPDWYARYMVAERAGTELPQ
jgi:catechol 2,3-dioxygenase-like lactoylglutathione lyase family enzyme